MIETLESLSSELFERSSLAALLVGGAALMLAVVCQGNVRPAHAADNCANLPTAEVFMKQELDKSAVKKIQMCLSKAGHYKGRIDGIKGPLTIAALQKAATKNGGASANQSTPSTPQRKPVR